MNTNSLRRHGLVVAVSFCLLTGAAASAQNAQQRRVINVKTVGQLYAAVNDPANSNVTVRLAPGTYVLSTYTKNGWLRPNDGALRMPRGMSLVGSERRVDTNGDGVPDPVSDETPDDFAAPGTETILDGSALQLLPVLREDCAGELFSAPNPVIHVGVHNRISHLTLFAGGNVAISEPSNQPVDPNGSLSMTITHSVIESSFLAISFSNCECVARRARSYLTFTHNVVRGAGFFGMNISNFLTGDASNDASDGPAIWATITSNLFYNNGRALRAAGADRGTDGGSVTLLMTGNVFRNNGENFQAVGAVSRILTPAVGNRIHVRSEFDTFGEAFANVSVFASIGGADDPRNSRVEAQFLHSRFIRDLTDTPPEISIVGGGGSNNRAKVLIRGATVQTSESIRTRGGLLIQDNFDPAVGTTEARLEGSREQFIQRNQGLPAPPAHFFLEHPHAGGG